MTKYELMLILSSTMSEEDRNHSIENLKALLEENKAKIVKEDVWGEKKLAYKINRSETGFYILYELELDGKLIKEISTSINLDRNIWRYMFSKIED